jgi:hypothetical protein
MCSVCTKGVGEENSNEILINRSAVSLLGKSNFKPLSSSSSVITFVQGIYNYIPQTDHVSTVYNLAAILWLQYIVHIMILPTLNTLHF